MENRCYICGAVGYEELLLTCMKCKSVFIHQYCMNTVEMNIPDDFIWVCEDCEETRKHVARKFTDQVPKRTVKLITEDESIAALAASQSSLSKGSRHLASPEKDYRVERSKKRLENVTNMGPPTSNLRGCSTEKSFTLPSPVTGSSSKQKSCVANPVNFHTQSPISKRSQEPQSSKERYVHAHTASTKSGLGSAQGGTLKTSNNAGEQRLNDEEVTIETRLPNHPSSRATWKGSFKIDGYASSCNDFRGYPPSKVGRKAYEFSKTMLGVLQFEAIPRSTVWADMFNDRGPNKNDIGLYFFPKGDGSELVSYLEKQDIVLRSCIRGVQFLVFSSSHLDEESKKINHAYYMWGLFVPPVITFKEPEKNQFPSVTSVLENEETSEMEIAMPGEAPVGKIGAPVPRDPHRSCSEMSKGAASVGQPVSEKQVKPEELDWDDLASPPEISAPVAWVEPRVPPGFEGVGKFRSVNDILQSGNDRRK